MSASTFTTQRQLMQKNMPASALDNPFAQQQKMLMYVLPLFFAISGVNFPIGVLLYWLTTNVWSMGQQFYVIRRMPAPGSQAERDLEARRARKGLAKTGGRSDLRPSRRPTLPPVGRPAPAAQAQPAAGQARAEQAPGANGDAAPSAAAQPPRRRPSRAPSRAGGEPAARVGQAAPVRGQAQGHAAGQRRIRLRHTGIRPHRLSPPRRPASPRPAARPPT